MECGSLPAEHLERSAPTRADDPQSALERGEIHRAGQDLARLPAARRQAAYRGLGHRQRASPRSNFTRSSRNSISSIILRASAAVASVSVSSIVQRLGNLLGHSVDVHSRPGKGSVFAVEASLGREQPGALPRRRRWVTVQNTGCEAAILVVEDDPSVREMLELTTRERRLSHCSRCGRQTGAGAGAGSDKARSCRRRLQSAKRLDRPPGLDGVREALGREIPAVILTGDISTETMREITRRGCVQRNKPVRAEELTHLIQSLLTEPRQPTVRASSSLQARTERRYATANHLRR